jgi:transposase-like protein
MSTKKRRTFAPDEKVSILKKNFLENVAVSDLCDQHGLHPTVFYRWQKEFFENGARAFEKKKDSRTTRLEKKIARLESKLVKRNEVLSELMEEHVALKKSLGEI